MTKNHRIVAYITPALKQALDVASRDSRVSASRIVNIALDELLPHDAVKPPTYETRKALREATLRVGRRRTRKGATR